MSQKNSPDLKVGLLAGLACLAPAMAMAQDAKRPEMPKELQSALSQVPQLLADFQTDLTRAQQRRIKLPTDWWPLGNGPYWPYPVNDQGIAKAFREIGTLSPRTEKRLAELKRKIYANPEPTAFIVILLIGIIIGMAISAYINKR